jgi:hypothetical protein
VRTSRQYGCCGGSPCSRGCTTGKLHLWNGIGPEVNVALDGYVQNRVRKTSPRDRNFGIYGLDSEMCYTARGTELLSDCGGFQWDSCVRLYSGADSLYSQRYV